MRSIARRFRPLEFLDILDETADIYKKNFKLLISISAIFYSPMLLLSLLNPSSRLMPSNPGSQADIGAAMTYLGSSLLIGLYYLCIAMPGVTGALTFAVSERYLGNDVTAAQSCKRAFKPSVFWPLFGTSLIFAVLIGLFAILLFVPLIFAAFTSEISSVQDFSGIGNILIGGLISVLLIVPFLYIVSRLSVIYPVVVLEDIAFFGSIGRSWSLLKGLVGKAFGTRALVNLVIAVVSMSIIAPLGLAAGLFSKGGSQGTLITGIYSLTSGVLTILTLSLDAILINLLYYDARIRKEGFDLEILAKELSERNRELGLEYGSSLPQERTIMSDAAKPDDNEI